MIDERISETSANIFLNRAGVLVGVLQGCAVRGQDHRDEKSTVFERRELVLQAAKQVRHERKRREKNQHDDPALLESRRERQVIASIKKKKKALGEIEDCAMPCLVLEQLRAHHGRERERDKARDDHRRRHGKRELGE